MFVDKEFLARLKELSKHVDADMFKELVTIEIEKRQDLTISERIQAKDMLQKVFLDKKELESKQNIEAFCEHYFNQVMTKRMNNYMVS
jgi:hypothetical protein